MPEKKHSSNDSQELRRSAEEKIRASEAGIQEPLSLEEMRKLLHELQVHQVELEMQNEELKASRQQFFVQYEIAPVGFLTLSEKGLILKANLTASNMFGVTKSALLMQPLTSFIFPEDQDIYYLHCKKLFEAGALQVCELRLVKKGGAFLWARLEAAMVRDADGAPVYCAVVSDITESRHGEAALRDSEEKYRTVANFTYDWETWIDPENKYKYVSPSCERITGYTPNDFIENQQLQLDITHPEDQAVMRKHFGSITEEPNICNFDFRIITKKGEERWISHLCQQVYDQEGRFIGRRGSNRDITDRKHLEEELIRAKKFETMSTFSAGITRDFNILLSGVLNYISLTKEDIKRPEDALKFLGEAEKILFKARDITTEFLKLSGAGIEYKNTAEPCRLIKDTASLSLKGSNVQCKFMLPEEGWEVKCDPNPLSQIISCVIENSREAMPVGGGLKISAEYITHKENEKKLPLKDGLYFLICISDNGCGISKKNLPRIFDPYFSTKKIGAQKGMGLGLAVANSIISRLNGSIHVESQEGVGTEVFIYLPAIGERESDR